MIQRMLSTEKRLDFTQIKPGKMENNLASLLSDIYY